MIPPSLWCLQVDRVGLTKRAKEKELLTPEQEEELE
jgi:hypothetical protein